MNGDSSGLYLLNSYLSDTIKNLRQKGLNENTYSTLNRCFLTTIQSDLETSSGQN